MVKGNQKVNLTPRQQEVIELLAKGLSCKSIASKLFLSIHTVKQHILDIKTRLAAQNAAHAIYLYYIGDTL